MAGDPEGTAVAGGPGEDAAEEPAAAITTRCVPSRAQPRRLWRVVSRVRSSGWRARGVVARRRVDVALKAG